MFEDKNYHLKNKKILGEVFTPSNIVKNILDICEYYGQKEKHIIDNSCGDGAFLLEIVKRYCNNYIGNNLKSDLETYIHGIEINPNNYNKCINNLNCLVEKYNLYNVKWDIINDDAFNVEKFNNKMDFVVGNPPYVRIHNIKSQNIKNYTFSSSGMSDLYIAFYEISFSMLNDFGKMSLITPNSWFTSNAGMELRKYIVREKHLSAIIDLEHYQPFNANVYTAISVFDNSKKTDEIKYYTLNENGLIYHDILKYQDFEINNKFYFSNKNELKKLKNILAKKYKKTSISVKNGLATLADTIFIGDYKYNQTIKIIKASTGEWKSCIFPYNINCKPLSFSDLDKDLQEYLLFNKDKLINRDIRENIENGWYLFGRTQGLSDIFKNKISINTIIKDIKSIKINKVPSGSALYSGLYIICNYSFDTISKILLSNEFIEYIHILKKYKSGGYYTFSSHDLQNYLNYKLEIGYEQTEIF